MEEAAKGFAEVSAAFLAAVLGECGSAVARGDVCAGGRAGARTDAHHATP